MNWRGNYCHVTKHNLQLRLSGCDQALYLPCQLEDISARRQTRTVGVKAILSPNDRRVLYWCLWPLTTLTWWVVPDCCSWMLALLADLVSGENYLKIKRVRQCVWKCQWPTCCAAEDIWSGRAVGNDGRRVSRCRSIKGQCASGGELTWWSHRDCGLDIDATVSKLSLWLQSAVPVLTKMLRKLMF